MSHKRKHHGNRDKKLYEALQASSSKITKQQTSILKQWKEATTSEEVVSFFDEAEYIEDIDRLARLGRENILVKEKSNEAGIDSAIVMKDLQVNARGPREDEAYTLNPFILKNIRRGNTIIGIQDNGKFIKHYMGRKGLTKFFDLSIDFVDPAYRYDDSNLNTERQNIKNYILAPALKAMLDGHQVELIKTLKANGENSQVSYNPDIGAWIISSKNVAIPLRKRGDLAKYETSRCSFAMEMAEVWFNKLEEVEAKGMLPQLKKDMANLTFVGEYIGSIEHQHMVKYNRITIIFYAVVDNHSPEICWPSDQALQLFKKYELDVVNITSLGLYNDYESLCNALYNSFRDIAKGKITDEEEGAVIYLTKRDKSGKSTDDSVLSLCKLKTIEYRIFRKMREKLRNYYRNSANRVPEGIVTQFKKETLQLCQGNELPKELNFYVGLMKAAFEFIKKQPDQLDMLNNEYITFQESLLMYYAKQNQFDKEDLVSFDSKVLDLQQNIAYEKPEAITKVDNTQLLRTESNHNQNTLYKLRIILFCPPGLIQEVNMMDIRKQFKYKTVKEISKHEIEQLVPQSQPHLVQVCTLEGKYMEEGFVIDENTEYIIYGFTSDHVQKSIDYILNSKFKMFEGKNGAVLNKFFNSQLDKVEGLKMAFGISNNSSKLHDLNLKEVGAPLEPKLLQKLKELREKSQTIVIEEEEVKESFKNIDQNIEVMFDQQEEEKKGGNNEIEYEVESDKNTVNESFKTANESSFYATAENCYDVLKSYENMKKLLLIIIPFGTPGSGKSTFLKTLKTIANNLDWKIDSISSDEIRMECMNNMIKLKNCSRKEAFDKTAQSATKQFNSRLETLLRNGGSGSSPVHIIFIDKNHPVNGLQKTNQIITECTNLNRCKVKKLYLIPQITREMQGYPFSSSFILQCHTRLMKRDTHETLDNSDLVLTTQILFMFVKMYFKEKFDQVFLRTHDINMFMRIPLTVDDSLLDVPKSIEQQIEQILKDTKKGQKPEDEHSINAFIEEVKPLEQKILSLPFDQVALEFAILDQLLLATDTKDQAINAGKEGVQTRSMIAKQKQQIESNEEEEKVKPNKEVEEETKSGSKQQPKKGKKQQNEDDTWNMTVDKKGKGKEENIKITGQSIKKWAKPPLYIGISVDEDKKCAQKVKDIFMQSLTVLHENYSTEGFDELNNALKSAKKGGQFKGWKVRPDFHVTVMFLGQDKSKQQSPIFKNFEEGVAVEIEIRAFIIVPEKIMTAVCFPAYEIDNKHPHMTLVTGKWDARKSNDALEGTVGKGQVFHELYMKAWNGQGNGEYAFANDVTFGKENLPAYFVILPRFVSFDGVTKGFAN